MSTRENIRLIARTSFEIFLSLGWKIRFDITCESSAVISSLTDDSHVISSLADDSHVISSLADVHM